MSMKFDSIKIEAMSFKIVPLKFKLMCKIITLLDSGIKSFNNGLVGLSKNGVNDYTSFEIINVKHKSPDIYMDDLMFRIETGINKFKYLRSEQESGMLNIKFTQPDRYCIFNIYIENGFITIQDAIKRVLCIVDKKNQQLKFLDEKDIIANKNLFRLKLDYIIL